MNIQNNQIKPFVYTTPEGLRLEVLFVLSPEQKGYINATAIADQFGKKPHDWLKYKNVQDYIYALLETMNRSRNDNYRYGTKSICYDDIVVAIQGGSPEKQGTWLHPKLAVVFARWLSPHFAVWCDEQIGALLQQHPEQQRQFPELSMIFNKMNEMDQRFHALEQRIEQRLDTTEQALNIFQSRSSQEMKKALGQVYTSLNQLNKMLSHQAQMDFLKPYAQDMLKKTLLDYQQVLEQLLRGHQDELIQGYLVGIQENLARLVQHIPQEPEQNQDHDLASEIETLRTAGRSWNHIAQLLNERGVPTASGKGKWYGSSVKKYYEAQASRAR